MRAAHASEDFEIVGVKVFSPHKNGRDAGELVGIGPIGVRATLPKDEILAMDADCVIVAPSPQVLFEGLDDDVIALLESGKNVVTTAAHHNVARPNWYDRAKSPTERLRALSRIPGMARSDSESTALRIARAMTGLRALDALTDPLLAPLAKRRFPAGAEGERIARACRTGNSSLHGTGVHPTFMVERQLMRRRFGLLP
ncbi:hypothetical protein [Nocardia sp. NPDC052112]|uniref:hypothetical protein n=1 Tax=Nocardia sp. NPDC052112 TaxID=3155646 RepID=UPI003437CCDE